MAWGAELNLQGFLRSASDSDGPSTVELHLHPRHCRRVFQRTHDGILPPTEEEARGPLRCWQFRFSFEVLSEFRRQMWISIASLDISLSLCSFLYLHITSFVVDAAAETPTRLCPPLLILADIKFAQEIYIDYTPRPLQSIQPGTPSFANENSILGTSMDRHTFSDGALVLEMPAVVGGDTKAGTEMLKRIQRGQWVMGGEVNCSVCLEEFSEGEEVMTMECKHCYHEECILTWFLRNQTCPLCRRQI